MLDPCTSGVHKLSDVGSRDAPKHIVNVSRLPGTPSPINDTILHSLFSISETNVPVLFLSSDFNLFYTMVILHNYLIVTPQVEWRLSTL